MSKEKSQRVPFSKPTPLLIQPSPNAAISRGRGAVTSQDPASSPKIVLTRQTVSHPSQTNSYNIPSKESLSELAPQEGVNNFAATDYLEKNSASMTEEDSYTSQPYCSLPDPQEPLAEEIRALYKTIDNNLKKGDKIQLTINLKSLRVLTENTQLESLHPLFFQRMAAIYVFLDKKDKASDCLAKQQRRIEKFYFEKIDTKKCCGINMGSVEDAHRLKMEVDIDQEFTMLKQIEKKSNKRKRVNSDTYHLDHELNAFILKPENAHPFFNKIYPDLEILSLKMTENQQKKQKVHHYLKVLPKDAEEGNSTWQDDEEMKKIKEMKEQYKSLLEATLGKYEQEEKDNLKKYHHIATQNMQQKEISRQLAVENAFFSVKRTKNPTTLDFVHKIMKSRYAANGSINTEKPEFDMVGKSARCLITAERWVMKQSLNSQMRTRIDDSQNNISQSSQNNQLLNKTNDTKEKINYSGNYTEYRTWKTNKSPNHLENYCINNLGKYSEISQKISALIGDNDTKKSMVLATEMLNLIKNGMPITEKRLQEISGKKCNMSESVKFLTAVCVNFYKEVHRRANPSEKKHEIPYAVAQARALLLAKAGKIHLLEMFDTRLSIAKFPTTYDKVHCYGAPYGLPTTSEKKGDGIACNVDKVQYKLNFINTEYNKFLLEKNADRQKLDLFFKEGKEKLITISTHKQIHRDLLDVFGGENDTDGEGYSSDETDECGLDLPSTNIVRK